MMPQLRGTSENMEGLKYQTDLLSWTIYDYLKLTDAEVKKFKVKCLYEMCSELAKDLLGKNYYFVGFAKYNFSKVSSPGKEQIVCDMVVVGKKFNSKLASEEYNYWGNSFTERMVYELACFLGIEEYFAYGTPWKAM